MMNNIKQQSIGESIVKIREPENIKNAKIAIMLHGLTGDESSMWIFGNKLSNDWLIISPRAPFPSVDSNLDGYSWVNLSIKQRPTYQDFFPSVDYLSSLIEELVKKYTDVDFSKINLIGFSQGTAMAFVYAGSKPNLIEKLVSLSGYLPEGYEGFLKPEQMDSVQLFIGHGERDEIVPIERAKTAKKYFEGYGKKVVYCASDVGHQLGNDCFKAFQNFMTN